MLTSLQGDTRHNLQLLLKEYGTAVKQGGPAYNRSIQFWLPAYEYTSIVAHDALGIQPHDLSNWIAQMGTVSGALDAHPQNLQSLITDFNTTAAAFARQSANLQRASGGAAADPGGGDPHLQRAQPRVPAPARCSPAR